MIDEQALHLTTADGHRFGGRLFLAADAHAPVLLFMPAMGTRARFYTGLGQALAASGVSFAVFDWRGIDSSSLRASRGVDFGYRELLEQDLPAAAAAVRAQLADAPLWIGGHSLGGQLAACFAARHPQNCAGLCLIASGSVYWRSWGGRGAIRILGLTQIAVVLSQLVGHFPGRRIGFGGIEARSVIRDWAAVARHGNYRPRGSAFDYEAALAQLRLPVLALSFGADGLAPLASTQRLLDKMPCAARSLWHVAPGVDGKPFDHFSWARSPQVYAAELAARLRGIAERTNNEAA